MKIGALIPARGGSKRVPSKNIVDLGGRPLVAWTIDALVASDAFDDITLSTDCDEIAGIVRSLYPRDKVSVLMRGEDLAGDDSPMRKVIEHYYAERQELDWCGVFLPTYPFRKVNSIIEARNQIFSGLANRIESVTMAQGCSSDLYYPDGNGVRNVYKGEPVFCRFSSACYVFKPRHAYTHALDGSAPRFNERAYRISLDRVESVDIDTHRDLGFARKIVEGAFCIKERNLHYVDAGNFRVTAPEGCDMDTLISHIGMDLLNSDAEQILFLDEMTCPYYFFRTMEPRKCRYYMDDDAHAFLTNGLDKVNKTQNMQHSPKLYLQNHWYRAMRRDRGGDGASYLPPSEFTQAAQELPTRFIPGNNVILMSSFVDKPWYVSPLLIGGCDYQGTP